MADFPGLRHDGTGRTLYITIMNNAGQLWDTAAEVFEAYDGTWGNYDIAAVEDVAGSYIYNAEIPANLTADIGVILTYFEQAGGAVAITDPIVADATWYHDGSTASDILIGTTVEPGQGAPAATIGLIGKLRYVYKNWRNKKTQTATTFTLMADDASTADQISTVSDDGTTFTKGEIATGA